MAKILIVDDEQINLDFFEVMLSKLGFDVAKASNGEEALEVVRSEVPDLVVLDNIMPKLSGWEVTRILKQDPEYAEFREIPIVMFSAMDDVKDKIEGFELGVEDYITKPFNFSEVLARIKAVLRNRDLSQQVIQRERRIALVESLNKSLVYFTEHLRGPVLQLRDAAKKLDPRSAESVAGFAKLVESETESTLAALEGLEDEIVDLRQQGDAIKEGEITLEALDAKYQKHFQSLKEKAGSIPEAKSVITAEKQKVLEIFAEGRKLYKLMKFDQARAKFVEALKVDSGDGPSKVYLARCKHYMENPPPEDWDGVFVMSTK